MRLHRGDPAELGRRAELYTAKASAEEVLHPPDDTEQFEEPGDLEGALDSGDLRPFTEDATAARPAARPAHGRAGAAAGGRARDCTAALRPGAYALAVYMARLTREASRVRAPLTITSTVRDAEYQDLLVGSNPEATPNYSLHTTGWAFDVVAHATATSARRWASSTRSTASRR